MRTRPSLDAERAFWELGHQWVAGLDEAGRGAWAGPVFAAAVILPSHINSDFLRGLTDSKQLSPKQRERFAALVRQQAISWGIGQAEACEIDRIGIVAATKLAMWRAIAALSVQPEALIIDAIALPEIALPQRAFPFADSLSLSVAAASVLAKTARDFHMSLLDARWPGYGFSQHKGYGTPQHLQQLQVLGPSPQHRLSFKPLRALMGGGMLKDSSNRAPV
ncbi:MAG: ribonuclease HII [Thermoflexales bacterium]